MVIALVGLMATTPLFGGENNSTEKNNPEKIENLSDTLPFFEVVIAGIPTVIGAWGTYSVLTGERSPVEWARVLNKVAASDRLSIIIRNAFQHLKTHELVALIASGGAFMGGMICTTANLVAAIACGMKAYRTKGADREKWLHNTSVAVARCAGSFVLCGASVICMALLADYKQSGDPAFSHT